MTNVTLHLAAAGVLVALSARSSFAGSRERKAEKPQRRGARPRGGGRSGGSGSDVRGAAGTAEVTRISRSVDDNPVLWREVRRPLIGRKSLQIACGIIVVLLLLISYMALAANNDLGDSDAQMGYAIIFNGLLWLVTAVISATAIAQEKESDTWTLLLATPLSARQIVLGKFLGLLRRLVLPFGLIVAHFVVFALCNLISWTAVGCVLWVMISFNSVWLALGLYLSLRCKKVTFAVIVNLLVPIGIYAVVPLLGAILGQLVGGPHRDRYAEAVCYYLPYFYLGSAAEALRPSGFRDVWMPSSTYNNYNNYPPDFFISCLMVWSLVYLGVATAILAYTTSRFNRIVGRAEQTDPLPPPVSRRSGLVGS